MKLTLHLETYVTFPYVETTLKVLMMFITLYDHKYITEYIFSINLVNLKCQKWLLTKLEVMSVSSCNISFMPQNDQLIAPRL